MFPGSHCPTVAFLSSAKGVFAAPGPSPRLFAFLAAILALLVARMPGSSLAAAQPAGLSVEGTEFILTTDDGATLRSRDLVGAVVSLWTSDGPRDVTIRAVERRQDALGNAVWLHDFATVDNTGNPVAACRPDANGETLGFPYPTQDGFDLACTSGAAGKCILWGYGPRDRSAGGGLTADLHQACIRMVRADYGGDGGTATRDGTAVRFCDAFDIHACPDIGEWRFEAAWTAAGADCVARVRIADLASLAGLDAHYSRLRGRTGPDACRFAPAFVGSGAILYSFIR